MSPSTAPILISELTIADLIKFSLRLLELSDSVCWPPPRGQSLWREHRKEPGCVVGEHKHVFLCLETVPLPLPLPLPFPAPPLHGFVTDIDRRPREIVRSTANRTDREDGEEEPSYMVTRVGEEERVTKAVDDANPEDNDCDGLRVL